MQQNKPPCKTYSYTTRSTAISSRVLEMYSISIYQIREVITSVVAAKKHLKILTWVQMDVQVGQDNQARRGGYTM